jgi:outer membrane protein OmpA-like peptidoglycan-associated protein
VKIFQLATDGYDRVSITFHFPAGSATPDAQAEADIGRVAALLQQPSFRTAEITLIGFASTANGEDKQLSTRRASAIRNALLLAGVSKTSAVAVGAAAPISCNLDAASQALNQRVEVWVRRG